MYRCKNVLNFSIRSPCPSKGIGHGEKELYDPRQDMKRMHSTKILDMLITYFIKGISGADRKAFSYSLLESLFECDSSIMEGEEKDMK